MPDKTAPKSAENPPAPGGTPAPADFFRLPEHRGLPFQEVVALLHRHLRPRSYLEIGAHACGTLAAANCASVAIDRGFVLDNGVLGEKPSCCFFRMAADDFFDAYDPKAMLNGPVEVALLHGTPLFEVALRAFMNIERHCKRNSVVLVPGCIPTDAYVARRELADDRLAPYSPHRDWWAGDLWKFAVILKKVRADLRVRAFNAAPAGLIAITALDPASEVLENNYFGVAEQFRSALLNQRGAETYLQSLGVARTDVFQNAEALSALFWL